MAGLGSLRRAPAWVVFEAVKMDERKLQWGPENGVDASNIGRVTNLRIVKEKKNGCIILSQI